MRGKNNTTQTHRNSIKSGYCLNDNNKSYRDEKPFTNQIKIATIRGNVQIAITQFFWWYIFDAAYQSKSYEVANTLSLFVNLLMDELILSITHSTLATKRIRCLIQFTSNKSRQIQQIKLTQTSQTERLSNVANSKANIMDMNGSECYASEILRWAPVFDLEICFTTIPTAERSDRIVCVCVCVVFRIWMNMYRACERTKYECFKLVAE